MTPTTASTAARAADGVVRAAVGGNAHATRARRSLLRAGARAWRPVAMIDRYRPEPRRRTTSAPGPTTMIRTKADRERFRAELLAALPGPDQQPRSTNDLRDLFQLDAYGRSGLLWVSLDRMARDGLVERVVVSGQQLRYWRRTEAGEQHLRGE